MENTNANTLIDFCWANDGQRNTPCIILEGLADIGTALIRHDPRTFLITHKKSAGHHSHVAHSFHPEKAGKQRREKRRTAPFPIPCAIGAAMDSGRHPTCRHEHIRQASTVAAAAIIATA